MAVSQRALIKTDTSKRRHVFCLTGLYKVDVKLGGAAIVGSPFFVKSFDKSRVRVFGLLDGVVDVPTSFTGLPTWAEPGPTLAERGLLLPSALHCCLKY